MKKTDVDGNVIVYKAAFYDYDETFSPVAMLKLVQIMLAIAAFYDYEIWQMDIKTAFLINGFLKEEFYMMQQEGFFDPKGPNKVCKLHRSFYGLEQASRNRDICFDGVIKAFRFIQCLLETCIYNKVSGSTTAFLIGIYVNDILLIGNDVEFSGKHKGVFERSFLKEKTSVKLLTYWASRSIEIDQDA